MLFISMPGRCHPCVIWFTLLSQIFVSKSVKKNLTFYNNINIINWNWYFPLQLYFLHGICRSLWSFKRLWESVLWHRKVWVAVLKQLVLVGTLGKRHQHYSQPCIYLQSPSALSKNMLIFSRCLCMGSQSHECHNFITNQILKCKLVMELDTNFILYILWDGNSLWI